MKPLKPLLLVTIFGDKSKPREYIFRRPAVQNLRNIYIGIFFLEFKV